MGSGARWTLHELQQACTLFRPQAGPLYLALLNNRDKHKRTEHKHKKTQILAWEDNPAWNWQTNEAKPEHHHPGLNSQIMSSALSAYIMQASKTDEFQVFSQRTKLTNLALYTISWHQIQTPRIPSVLISSKTYKSSDPHLSWHQIQNQQTPSVPFKD